MGTVKYAEFYLHEYWTVVEGRRSLSIYFDFYNTVGLHQRLCYWTPPGVYLSAQVLAGA